MKRHLVSAGIASIVFFVAGCVSAPLDYPKHASVAIADTSTTIAAEKAAAWLDGRTDVNGFYPLTQGFDAFGMRLGLMGVAEISIDAQYFLMKPDDAGLVFAAEIMKAADRGVRVRLLLDDIFTTVKDVDLAMLDAHPNIEVRIFNPVARKGIGAFNYLGNFSLSNRRMHNKAFIVDNQIAVVGGRNIAVEYFQLETSGEFIDFDMLSTGPVVKQVSSEFDTYWNHKLAVPMQALFDETNAQKIEAARARMIQKMAAVGDSIYAEAINTPLMKQIIAQSLDPYSAQARLITDDPGKLLEKVSDDQKIVVSEIRDALAEAYSEIIVFTPYFVPRSGGIELIRQLREKGLRIVVITNSLATNNHTAVHSAYSSYRRALLEAGVELWEARADAAQITAPDGETQLDKLTLHTKGILIDKKRIFVGSLNLDPRSIDINTEMGLLIDSPELAELLTEDALRKVPRMAYRLELDQNDRITWHATIAGQEVVETKEPQTSAWQRFAAWFLKIAPEKQL